MPEQKRLFFNHPIVLSFLAIIAAVEFIRMSLFLTFLPSFMTNLHFDTVALGSVISANILADNLSKSATGWLVDKKGPWPVLLIGSVVVLLGILIIINFHRHLSLLTLAAMLIGLGVAPTWPAAISGTIQAVGESKRAMAISLISVIWLAGGGLGSVLMGFLIDTRMRLLLNKLHLPIFNAYKTGFLLMTATAVWAIVVCIFAWFSWHRTPHIQKTVLIRERNKPYLKDVFHRLWMIKGLIPGMFFQTLSLGMLLPNLLPYATRKLGLSESQYGILLLTGGLVVVLFLIPAGHWADRLGPRPFLVSGFSLAAASLMFLALRGNAGNIWWIVALLGLAYALIQPSWNSLLAGVIPPSQRGVLMGMFMSIEGLGFGIGPIIGGLLGRIDGEMKLLQQIGPAIPFFVSSLCLGLMALIYLLYPFHQYQMK